MTFDILPDKGSITTAHLAEAPGGFIQATHLYRNKYFKNDVKNDKYSTISIRSNNSKEIPTYKPVLNSIKQLTLCDIEDCDILKKTVQDKYVKKTGLVDLVTGDGGFVWKDENYQEQEAYRIIMAEIVLALKLQKKSGSFVLKIFDTFTDVTVKMIAILRAYYKKVYIFVPLMSRPSNSEKYIVCMDFMGVSDKEISNLEVVLEQMNDTTSFTVDILPDYQLPESLKQMNKSMSVELSNQQFKSINIMISYLNKGVFFGDDYHQFRDAQIKANEYWLNTFYPSKMTQKKIT
jgi:23S rRNA U2552 (ribose-2'-O)-methylase RlmE/FtsJ